MNCAVLDNTISTYKIDPASVFGKLVNMTIRQREGGGEIIKIILSRVN